MPRRNDSSPRARSPRRGRTVARVLLIAAGVAVAASVVAALVVHSRVRGSLPPLEGTVGVPGLRHDVRVDRDARGVVTIRGADRIDVARATGLVHAQDRFFQMDLLRRQAAGELAELLGAPLADADARMRRHRFRALATRIVTEATADERALLEAYADGVNAGLATLAARPFEYLILRAPPEPWRPADSILVVFAMYVELQDENGTRETALGAMWDTLPPPLAEFLTTRGTEWDAPIVGGPIETPPVPDASVVDLRRTSTADPSVRSAGRAAAPRLRDRGPVASGSNSWVVSGERTAHGGALVSNDMHLPHGIPNIWYRARLEWGGRDDTPRHAVTGVTLPGAPPVVVGSNGAVAWGFTNSYGDWSDVIVVERDAAESGRYLTPDGSEPFVVHRERIEIRGAEAREIDVRWTRWGPIMGRDHRGRELALRWVAHEPAGAGLGITGLEIARSVAEALDAAAGVAAPAQNLVVGDRDGNIGWTLLGPIPRRAGCDEPERPRSGARDACTWLGLLEPSLYPRVVNPPGGRLWTANSRVVDGPDLALLGDGGYVLGARARQIRDGLAAREILDERGALEIQLDDRALFLSRWRDLLLETASEDWVRGDAAREAFRRHVEDWGGRASVGSVGFRLVRGFRIILRDAVFEPIFAECRRLDERCDQARLSQIEGPLWRMLEERPAHLLGPEHQSWEAMLAATLDRTVAYFTADGRELAEQTWGARNDVTIRHPMSFALPWLSRWLDIPTGPLPGDAFMPRVQGPGFGASQRMVVAPGRESSGVFHMPGGQSGHPLSPHYRDGHSDWAEGRPAPFLPGPPVATLELRPVSAGRGE